ncbi:MAG TPA: MarR family transcriptional regulator [Caulobacteraceae bacterium]|jgi:DNA-binding MarR family transcriptional regulator|nr:MarR family transcriptional regulator [Caulobacteraceae bacterium]
MAEKEPLDFGPLDQRIGYQLRRAFLRSNGLFARLGGEAGVAPGQFGVLKLVELNPGRSQTEIAAAAGLDRSSLTQLLDQLVKRRLIERRPGRDRRTVSLHMTDEGRTALARAEPRVEEHEAVLRGELSDAEAAVLLELLTRLLQEPPAAAAANRPAA